MLAVEKKKKKFSNKMEGETVHSGKSKKLTILYFRYKLKPLSYLRIDLNFNKCEFAL